MAKVSKEVSTSFHNDSRETVVVVDGQIYDLIPSETWTMNLLEKTHPSKRPHARVLGPIPFRTKAEQEEYNFKAGKFHQLCEGLTPTKDTPLQQVKRAVSGGKKLTNEIASLLKQKDQAIAKGDIKEAKRIRKALRSLDYKRYGADNNKTEG